MSEATADIVHAYSEWAATVPDEMGSSVLLIRLPDIPEVPEPIRGRYVSHLRFAWSGPVEDGERWVRPFRKIASPLIDTVRDMPYGEVGSIHQEPTFPVPFVAKNTMLRAFDGGAAKALLDAAGPLTDPPYLVELRHFGGALSRAPRTPNAIGRRDGTFCLYSGAVVTPGSYEGLRAAQAALHQRLRPWATGGVCINFLTGPEVSLEDLRSAYLPVDYERLTALKKVYDPGNMFRINHNIPPA